MHKTYRLLSLVLPILAILVVIKGAYVRLSDAGLGCPDWPGCYGQILVPKTAADIANPAHLAARPLETGKAWLEMIHRYMASTLGLLIVLMAGVVWRLRQARPSISAVSYWLVPLVCFQGALGMWTVTLLLKPFIVTAHLLGGISTFALLCWNDWAARAPSATRVGQRLWQFTLLAIAVLAVQLFLGGWTSTNYAALACTDFPTCQGSFWPRMNFNDAFVLWRGLGVNYEFGVLDTPARTAIHFAHRLWAAVTTGVIVTRALKAFRADGGAGRQIGLCILALVCLQVALGITNVMGGLPLPVAVMHNGTAALLMGSLATLLYFSTRPQTGSDTNR
jgi:cytochrome c oxidase assembly protein subunit 15